MGYLGHLHLLLPRVNALLQPPVVLLGLHVLGDAGSLVLRDLAAQTLVESFLPATLLRKQQQRCRTSAETLSKSLWFLTNLLGLLQLLFQPQQLLPAIVDVAAQLVGLRCYTLQLRLMIRTHTHTQDKIVLQLPLTCSLPRYLV